MDLKIKFVDQPPGFDLRNNCYVRALRRRYNVVLSDEPQLVFYSCFGTDFLSYPESVRVFLANEPVIPNFNDCDYAIGSMQLSFADRYFRQVPITNYGEDPYWERLRGPGKVPPGAAGRKFCNFVYANARLGTGAKKRIDFCRRLQQYRSVDCPGQVLNNMSGGIAERYHSKRIRGDEGDFNDEWANGKLAFLRNYKFTIAFENTAIPGFTTEKLIHPLMARSIPIYWGDPIVSEVFNPRAFINCADYGDDLEAVARRVIELDGDEEQYLEMLRQPPLREDFPFDWEDRLLDFLSAIVEGGCKPVEKNPIGFTDVCAQDMAMLSREGKLGMRVILQNTARSMRGWLRYKLHKTQGGS